jgi:hypothetical protein
MYSDKENIRLDIFSQNCPSGNPSANFTEGWKKWPFRRGLILEQECSDGCSSSISIWGMDGMKKSGEHHL